MAVVASSWLFILLYRWCTVTQTSRLLHYCIHEFWVFFAKYRIGEIRRRSSSCNATELSKVSCNWVQWKSYCTVHRGLHEILLVVCKFSSQFDKIRCRRCSKNLSYYEFGARAQKAALLRTAISQFLADFYIYCPLFFFVFFFCEISLPIIWKF